MAAAAALTLPLQQRSVHNEGAAEGYTAVVGSSPGSPQQLGTPTPREVQVNGHRGHRAAISRLLRREWATISVLAVVVLSFGVVLGVTLHSWHTGAVGGPADDGLAVQLQPGLRCDDEGLIPIRNESLCLAAATELGLEVRSVHPVPMELYEASPSKFPPDCYSLRQAAPMHMNTLWMNRNALLPSFHSGEEEEDDDSGAQRQAICLRPQVVSVGHSEREAKSEGASLGDSFKAFLWGATSTTTQTTTTSGTTTHSGTTSTATTTGTSTSTRTGSSTTATTSTETSSTQTGTWTTTPHRLPTLFCYTVIQVKSYEYNNVRTMIGMHTSIFACDGYVLFSDQKVSILPGMPKPGHPGVLDAPGAAVETEVLMKDLSTHPKEGSLEGILNTQIFMKAWNRLGEDGEYKKHDWVVKVDPDAVFLPKRLQQNLAQRAPATGQLNMYFINCKLSFGLFGAIEVLSQRALTTYLNGQDRCKRELDWTVMGEDLWMVRCLDLLGVEKKEDFELLSDGYCNEPPSPCVSGKVAFHAFKTAMQFMECVHQAEKSPPAWAASPEEEHEAAPDAAAEERFMQDLMGGRQGRPQAPSAAEYEAAVSEFLKSGHSGLEVQ